ncbi:hypothetical protein L1049_021275 [Liquidambar formosana]|uniref:Uncharacterized protein n=1 Tax=Liquidambar formosana TaxID=63359 RepID=A0AAP0S910_LIQFO
MADDLREGWLLHDDGGSRLSIDGSEEAQRLDLAGEIIGGLFTAARRWWVKGGGLRQLWRSTATRQRRIVGDESGVMAVGSDFRVQLRLVACDFDGSKA